MQGSLFDQIEPVQRTYEVQHKDPPLIASKGIKEICMDFETTGLRWWETDEPIGAGVCLPDGTTSYTAWAHRGGGNNISREAAIRWMQTEWKGVRITNLNTRFEVHMARTVGVDLEAMGCEVSDVGHYAALLDDHRKRFSLEALVADMLEGEAKVKQVGQVQLDGRQMAEYHADIVAVRAMADVRQVHKLKALMWPKLDAEDLQRVRQLEDEVIFVVCEMERNGAIIDQEAVERWLIEIRRTIQNLSGELFKMSGIRIGSIRSPKDRAKLFEKFGVPLSYTSGQNPSFTDEILKAVDHPGIKLLRRITKLLSVEGKIKVYRECADSKGVYRYGLHQLRSVKNDGADSGESGTVSGRFSSTEIVKDVGGNIQQIMKAAKQRVAFGYDEDDASHDDEIFIIRKLHIPESGLHLSADAMQIEYRLFADKTRSKRLIDAYKENPMMSFHKFMHAIIKEYQPEQTYRRQKDLNFAKIYGAGIKKMALMLGFITKAQFDDLVREQAGRNHPLLAKTVEINDIYNREIPEVEPLIRRASFLAMSDCDKHCTDALGRQSPLHRTLEHRGYVRTVLGRRSRFPNNMRVHKALNAIIQGTAADIMKRKLVELHNERHYTGFKLRYTVHDEVDGDIPDTEGANRVAEVLNRQSFPQIKVPILWEVSTGANWRDCA